MDYSLEVKVLIIVILYTRQVALIFIACIECSYDFTKLLIRNSYSWLWAIALE